MDLRMVDFIAGLRAAGVRVSIAESSDAFRAVEQVGAVVPLGGVRRAPSRYGHAVREKQAQRLADLLAHREDRVEGTQRVLKNHGDFLAPDVTHGRLG